MIHKMLYKILFTIQLLQSSSHPICWHLAGPQAVAQANVF